MAPALTSLRVTVSGTPGAVVLEPTMLDRMSERTMPDSVSALAMPLLLLLEPSPGYGPAVSDGITEQLDVVDVVVVPVVAVAPVVVVAVVPVLVVVVEVLVVVPEDSPPPPQPSSGTAAAGASVNQRSTRRRSGAVSIRVARSWARPWAWG